MQELVITLVSGIGLVAHGHNMLVVHEVMSNE